MIVQFKPRQTKVGKNRIEALTKGKLRVFNCNGCGGEFEVLFDKFPETCPCCGVEFDWENSTYDRSERVDR